MAAQGPGPVEVGYGRIRAGINVLVGVTFFGGCLLVVESTVGRVSVLICLLLGALTVVRILNPRPQVLIGEKGVSVGGRWSSAVGKRRSAAWEEVCSVGPIRLAPPFATMQQGRIPTYPKWAERLLPREFLIERSSGRSLVVREPLDRRIDEVHVIVERAWTAGSR